MQWLRHCVPFWNSVTSPTTTYTIQGVLMRWMKPLDTITTVWTNFNLPHQHALIYYIWAIHLFGAPNGLCSSITESKHIKAVKEPWRWSSRFDTLCQMLLNNQRTDNLAAARADFKRWGMLKGTCLSWILTKLGMFSCLDWLSDLQTDVPT